MPAELYVIKIYQEKDDHGIENMERLPVIKEIVEDKRVYSIVREINSGGMGSVFEAVQYGAEGFQKTVAIKTLLAKFNKNKFANEMFIQEAKLVADLVHENIVQIYQFGKNENGYYIVIEYVNGLSLHDFVRHHRKKKVRMPRELAIFIISRIARGLAYAHSRTDQFGAPLKIVHRDVCPKNILITTEGLPKLADFGLALVTTEDDDSRASLRVGKIPFLPPEQAQRKPVDFRSDHFTLGAVLFELLSGRLIRFSKEPEERLQMALDGYINWDLLPKDLNQDVLEILNKCLAYEADDRYQSTSELARVLEYQIYKDGYGPTIQTLETYLREELPALYELPS